MNEFYLLGQYDTHNGSGISSLIWQVAFGLTLPVAGWLADTHTGRYKVIRGSVWIMWIATVLTVISSVIAQLAHDFVSVDKNVQLVLIVFMAVGFGAYQANIIQFGMDQLYDALSTEIQSFIVWYVWTVLSGGIIVDVISACLSQHYMMIRLLYVSANLSLALILLLCCNQNLIKEPVKHNNSFKTVYKIIKYAVRNKYPRQRSAFTYCEDELPSRIDFGKRKYGGPFTTEQVEDVKTFLRVLPVIVVGGALVGGVIASNYLRNKLSEMLLMHSEVELNSKMSVIECYREASFTHTLYYSTIVLIVLHEILLYPIFYRCYPRLESLQKAFIGMLLQLVRILILMAYEIVVQRNYLTVHYNTTTAPCLFSPYQETLKTSLNYYWMAIPDFIVSISYAMLYIGSVEYFSAQVPYFMKSLTVGITYSSLFLSGTVWLVLSIPFKTHNLSYNWGANCGFWYGLLLTIVEATICTILIILTKWYKKRRRQDVLPNEHIFAERYYS
jgi:peptide/histidine transporter 3/4